MDSSKYPFNGVYKQLYYQFIVLNLYSYIFIALPTKHVIDTEI